MEMNSVADGDDSDENKSNSNEDSVVKKKEKLRKQIEKLRSVILQAEWSLGISKFKDVEGAANPGEPDSSSPNIVPDISTQLQNELYRYAGFYCTKFTKSNYIFNLSPSHKCEKENQFSVQILNNDGKGTLGKWVMPMSVDMDVLVSATPIDNLQSIPHFLKTCKHYIDAYYSRLEQYRSLVSTVSQVKNCTVQSNLGYTQISLELLGVHNVENNVYLDLTIYLMYNAEESRPYKIEVDSKTVRTISDTIKKSLYASVKCFKSLDLSSAFDEILSECNGPFVWSKDDNDDSPVEVNNLSNSDEAGFLEEFTSQERSLAGHRRRKKIQRKQRVKGQRKASKPLSVSIKNAERDQQKKRKHDSETSKGDSEKNSNTEITTNKEKHISPKNTEGTPLKNERHKLKQTKLRFNLGQEQEPNEDDLIFSKNVLPRKVLKNRKNIVPLTSTPVRKSLKFSVSSNLDISDITVSENNLKEVMPHRTDAVPRKKIRVNTSSPMPKKKPVTKKGKQK